MVITTPQKCGLRYDSQLPLLPGFREIYGVMLYDTAGMFTLACRKLLALCGDSTPVAPKKF